MDRLIPCYQCRYCKTGEEQYCLSPQKATNTSCNKCCYCKTGEEQYCLYPQ